MVKLPRAHFVFTMHLSYVHPGVLFDRRFADIRPATRGEIRQAARRYVFMRSA